MMDIVWVYLISNVPSCSILAELSVYYASRLEKMGVFVSLDMRLFVHPSAAVQSVAFLARVSLLGIWNIEGGRGSFFL